MRDAAVQGLAVGFFDGVHLGHQAILKGAAAALTFRNHPLSVLAPERAPRLLMSAGERFDAIRACGVEEIVALDFTPELAAEDAGEFVRFLSARFPGFAVRCGANWRFGKGGEGTADLLRASGFDVTVVPFASHRGEPVSSTRIRTAIVRGEIEDANAMLGRRLRFVGSVAKGKGVGTRLGFPTVNIRPALRPDAPLPPCGVYLVEAGGVRALANFGFAPTLRERAWTEPVLEIHFPDTPPRLVPDAAEVALLRFLRPERTFATLEELRSQIAADCAALKL